MLTVSSFFNPNWVQVYFKGLNSRKPQIKGLNQRKPQFKLLNQTTGRERLIRTRLIRSST